VQSGDYLKDFALLYVRFASLGEEKSLQNKDICLFLYALAVRLFVKISQWNKFFHTLFVLPKHAIKRKLFIC